jgi:hypothetical protein
MEAMTRQFLILIHKTRFTLLFTAIEKYAYTSDQKKGVSMIMPTFLVNWWLALCGLIFLAILYVWSYWCTEIIARSIVPLTGLTKIVPLGSAIMMLRAAAYGLPGLLCYTFLSIFAPSLVIPFDFSFVGIPQGLILGIGYAALGSTVAQGIILIKGLILQLKGRPSHFYSELETLGSTGWIRGYNTAHQLWPRAGFLLAALTTMGEEMAFRGVALPFLIHGVGFTSALWITIIAFTGIQAITMPSWEPALIPMSSAFIMGLLQGYLAVINQSIFPLVVAHFSFFVVLLLFSTNTKGSHASDNSSTW